MVPNQPDLRQVAEVLQAMAAEAGFDLKVRLTEFATSLAEGVKGNFQLYLIGWSGRVDPDQNVINHLGCNTPFNWGKYCNETTQAALNEGRTFTDPAKRKAALRGSADADRSRPATDLSLSSGADLRVHGEALRLQTAAGRDHPHPGHETGAVVGRHREWLTHLYR